MKRPTIPPPKRPGTRRLRATTRAAIPFTRALPPFVLSLHANTRQNERHSRPLTDRAVEMDLPLMRLYDLLDDRKADAGASKVTVS